MIRSDLPLMRIIVSFCILLSAANGFSQQNDPGRVYSVRAPDFDLSDDFKCNVKSFEGTTEVPLFGWTGDFTALVVTDGRVYLSNIRDGAWSVENYGTPDRPFRGAVGATYYCMFWTDDTIYTYLEWQNSLLRQPYVDSGEHLLRSYANDNQSMVLTDKRIYVQVPDLPDYGWKIHDYAVTDVRLVGGELTEQDALVWSDHAMYFLYGFGMDLFPSNYEDGTARPLFGGMSSEAAYVATEERIYFFYVGIPEPVEVFTYVDTNETPRGGAVYEEQAMVWTNKNIYHFALSQVDITPLENGETPQGGGINQSFAHVRTDSNLYVWDGFMWNAQPYKEGERYIGGDMTYIKAIAWTDKRISLLDDPSGNWDTSIVFEDGETPVVSTFNHSWTTNVALVLTNRRIYVNDCFDRRWEIRELMSGEAPRGGASRNVLALAWTNKSAHIYDAGPGVKGWYDQTFESTESPRGGLLGELSAIIATDNTIYAFFKGATEAGWHHHPRAEDDGGFAGMAVSPFLVMMWTERQIYLCGFDVRTSVNVDAGIMPPGSYHLHQNYPNPFNPSTTIRFDLPVSSEVKLAIYNLNGQVVRKLADGKYASGSHVVVWDGTDESGARVASGLYVYRISVGEYVAQKKLVKMK